MTVMMKCGHAANAKDRQGRPYCVICIGIVHGADIVDGNPPDLTGRMARCEYYGTIPRSRNHESNYSCKRGEVCKCEQPSSPQLPFFTHSPDSPTDKFYCGCHGWD